MAPKAYIDEMIWMLSRLWAVFCHLYMKYKANRYNTHKHKMPIKKMEFSICAVSYHRRKQKKKKKLFELQLRNFMCKNIPITVSNSIKYVPHFHHSVDSLSAANINLSIIFVVVVVFVVIGCCWCGVAEKGKEITITFWCYIHRFFGNIGILIPHFSCSCSTINLHATVITTRHTRFMIYKVNAPEKVDDNRQQQEQSAKRRKQQL